MCRGVRTHTGMHTCAGTGAVAPGGRGDRKQQRVSHHGVNHSGPGTPESWICWTKLLLPFQNDPGGGPEQAQNGRVGTVSQSAGWAETPMGAPDQNAGLPSALVFVDGQRGLPRTPEGTGSRKRLESRLSEPGRTGPALPVVGLVKPSSKPWLPPRTGTGLPSVLCCLE